MHSIEEEQQITRDQKFAEVKFSTLPLLNFFFRSFVVGFAFFPLTLLQKLCIQMILECMSFILLQQLCHIAEQLC